MVFIIHWEKKMINDEPSVKEMCQLWLHVQKFIEDQDISCAETVGQCDRVIINAYEFIEGCCEIVGYVEYEDEDE